MELPNNTTLNTLELIPLFIYKPLDALQKELAEVPSDFKNQFGEWNAYSQTILNGIRPNLEHPRRLLLIYCCDGNLALPMVFPDEQLYSLVLTTAANEPIVTGTAPMVRVFVAADPELLQRLELHIAEWNRVLPDRVSVVINNKDLAAWISMPGDICVVIGYVDDADGCFLRSGLKSADGDLLSGAIIINEKLFVGCEVIVVGCGSGAGTSGGSRGQHAMASAILLPGATGVTASTIPVTDNLALVFAQKWLYGMINGAKPPLATRNARQRVRQSEGPERPQSWASWLHMV